MADTVTSNIIDNGPRDAVLVLTNESDGTGESNVLKVDATDLGPYGVVIAGQEFWPYQHMKVWRIRYDVKGMQVRLQWVAATPVDLLILTGYQELDFSVFGGLPCPNVAESDGSITLSTIGAVSGSSYSIALELRKDIAQTDDPVVNVGLDILTESNLILQTEVPDPLQTE